MPKLKAALLVSLISLLSILLIGCAGLLSQGNDNEQPLAAGDEDLPEWLLMSSRQPSRDNDLQQDEDELEEDEDENGEPAESAEAPQQTQTAAPAPTTQPAQPSQSTTDTGYTGQIGSKIKPMLERRVEDDDDEEEEDDFFDLFNQEKKDNPFAGWSQ